MVRLRWIVAAAGALVLVAGAIAVASGARPWRSHAPHVSYPAEQADTPPPAGSFDVATLTRPACPVAHPDRRDGHDEDGTDKLVEWGAVRLIVCTYRTGEPLTTMTETTRPAAVTSATGLMRRMISPRQSREYFGTGDDSGLTIAGGVPSARFLFQFPDGHVTEVTHNGAYYRGEVVRLPFSRRGADLNGLYPTVEHTCLGQLVTVDQSTPRCVVTGSTAAIP
ncbi:hypothetical protein Lfu02_57400 [Longispora fulva]|uniref:Uncharacterized protein n=1 Tax=Longispora fulva TaxID=619741 RepID=A0A8J7GR68_9ACTN|nr:hypothetical protein [Longispora fulva]MBG6137279.1 hypothetical protein [Longispora fulva]GIG61368.1 hypothetical protein Lfu02_57400 [Longispora fulva]